MRLSLLTAGAAGALLLFPAAAMAQTNTNSAPSANNEQSMHPGAAKQGSLRAQVRDMLQKEGFTDIRVMPSSFMVHAKDKDGNPVFMSISPDSFAEVAEVGTSSGSNNTTESTSALSAESTASKSGSEFVSVPNNGELSSNLIGLDIYNNSNQNVGQIKDIAMGPHGRTRAYILSVGGFLGVGDRYVAVNPSDVKVSYNDSDKKWHATMNATADQLKSAPEFKYSGRWNASKS